MGTRFPGFVEEKRLLGSCVWLTVSVPGWPAAAPGQFALLQSERSACFLARPLSIAQQTPEGRVSFLIAPVGTGTRELGRLAPGDELWVLGPLGQGFPVTAMLGDGSCRPVLVGGGVGVAPLPLLLGRLLPEDERTPAEVLVLLGFRDSIQAEAATPVLEAASFLRAAGVSCRCIVATEDGSVGKPGLVTAALSSELRPGDRVAVCGPWAMAEAVWRECSTAAAVGSWYSLEAGMACGVGSCHGCVIAAADGSLVRVCTEGPVFAGEEVWGRHPDSGEKEAAE